MEKKRFHPITLVGLSISMIAMGLLAYEDLMAQQVKESFVHIAVFLFLLFMIVKGILTNRKVKKKDK